MPFLLILKFLLLFVRVLGLVLSILYPTFFLIVISHHLIVPLHPSCPLFLFLTTCMQDALRDVRWKDVMSEDLRKKKKAS